MSAFFGDEVLEKDVAKILNGSKIKNGDMANGGNITNGKSKLATTKEVLFTEPMEKSCRNIKQVLVNDCTNRYQAAKLTEIHSPKTNYLLQSEVELAKYFGMKYALGVCSGGMAIMLGLKAIKRVIIGADVPDSNIRVYSNSFTFNAVPSAILNAGFKPILIETKPELTIDLEDLEMQLRKDYETGFKGKMILALSFMRGRIPDMDVITRLCKDYQCILLEDNAHGYGCEWKREKIGSFGVVSTISTQSNKLINTGEGGYVFTNNPGIMAFLIFSAGCYEKLYEKHEDMCPPADILEEFRFTVPNYSCRMTNIQGSMICEQAGVLQQRIDSHNNLYYKMRDMVLSQLPNKHCLEFIPQLDNVSPVYDSLQIRILDVRKGKPLNYEHPNLGKFIKLMAERSYKIQKFHDYENARYYRSWDYVQLERELPKTDSILQNTLDMRLCCTDTTEDIQKMASAIITSYKAAFC